MNLPDESLCNVNTLPSNLSVLSISFSFIDFWKMCRSAKPLSIPVTIPYSQGPPEDLFM